jgi:hypothetical protein
MARGQSQKLSAKVLSELTSSSGEITIRQEKANQINKALDEQVNLKLTPEMKALRDKYSYDKPPISEFGYPMRDPTARYRSPVTPKLDPQDYLNENPNGSLKDIIVYGDVVNLYKSSEYHEKKTPYRVTEVGDKYVVASTFDLNGKIEDSVKIIVGKSQGKYSQMKEYGGGKYTKGIALWGDTEKKYENYS